MSNNLTKREIVLEIYQKTGFPQKEVQTTVQMALDIIQNALSEGRNVELRNFGVLEVQVRKARIGRNPNKPETEVIIPTRAVVKFKSGKILKAKLKKLDLARVDKRGGGGGGGTPPAPTPPPAAPPAPPTGF